MHDSFQHRRYLIPFRGTLLPQIFCDTLIIGTGVAGLRAALAAAQHGEVILLAKTELKTSSTAWAQGGIAAVLGSCDDAVAAHVEDTLTTGCDLCDDAIVREVVAAARPRIEELRQWGMAFDTDLEGELDMAREGGHRASRILHAHGDATGRELVNCLARQVRQHPSIRIFENCFALDLLTPSQSESAPVLGAITWHPRYMLQMIWSWATILTSGGAGQIYRETTNPTVTTGDGLAMAWRAGAAIADMAFIQFHPTTLYIAGAERTLITEAVRGEGAYLVDRRGNRFLLSEVRGQREAARHQGIKGSRHQGVQDGSSLDASMPNPSMPSSPELAPRDLVTRSIMEHLAHTGETHVFLDARHFPQGYFAKRFPGITAQLARFDIDPQRDLIPVHPAAHYTIGGVWVDAQGRTTRPGLYACGEVSCSRLHGANRLASNSLLEGLVFGEVAGRVCAEQRAGENGPRKPMRIISDIPISRQGGLDLEDVRSSLRSVMWRHVGIARDGPLLRDVREMIDFWGRYTLDKIFDEPHGWETQNMLLVASLICDSALWREESRGVHSRLDFPEPRDDFRCHDLWRRGEEAPARAEA